MKKSLLIAAAAFFAMTATAQNKEWNIGEMFADTDAMVASGDLMVSGSAWDVVKNVTIDGLTFISKYDAEKEKQSLWTVDNNSKTATDGTTFTKRIKSGGASNWLGAPTDEDPVGLPEDQWTPVTRVMSFAVDGPCDVTLYYCSASSSTEGRMVQVYAGNHANKVFEAGCGDIAPVVCRYTGEATTLYISVTAGINFYGLKLSEATVQPDVFALYTYCDLAEGSENPDGVSVFGSISRKPAFSSSADSDEYEAGTKVTLTANPASNFVVAYWENGDGENLGSTSSIEVVMDGDQDITCYFKYVDPNNMVPGMMDPSSNAGSASIYNWKGQAGGDGKQRAVKIDEVFWPTEAQSTEGFDWNGHKLGKKGQYLRYSLNVATPGVYNIVMPVSNKNTEGLEVEVKLYAGVGDDMAEEALFTKTIVIETTGQNWIYKTVKVEDINIAEAGKYTLDIKNTSTAADIYVLYTIMGLGDNYGNWSEKDPGAGVENVAVDANEAPVRYFNLQGIEVNRDAKGLLILSNGTKMLNK